jgi:hypothetical protein
MSTKDKQPENIFKNVSGETVPPHGVMMVTNTIKDKGYVVLEITKSNGDDDKMHVVNSEVSVIPNSYGSYLTFGPMPIATAETSGDLGPVDDQWEAGPGNTWELLGVIRTGIAYAVRKKSSSTSAVFLTPPGGIPARTGMFNWSSAICERHRFFNPPTPSPEVPPKFEEVWNMAGEIGGNKLIKADPVDGQWVADVDPCI